MPYKPARPCRKPGCPNLTNDRSGYCEAHRQQVAQQYDTQRGTAAQRGYDYRWQKERYLYLQEHPLCAICLKMDPPRITAASLVDHVIPHKGNPVLFWDKNNWESLCDECHNRKTASEDGGFGNKIKGA